MRLGSVLRKWRLMCELDLRTAGKQMGLSAATLLRIEQGHDLSGVSLAKIINWLIVAKGAK